MKHLNPPVLIIPFALCQSSSSRIHQSTYPLLFKLNCKTEKLFCSLITHAVTTTKWNYKNRILSLSHTITTTVSLLSSSLMQPSWKPPASLISLKTSRPPTHKQPTRPQHLQKLFRINFANFFSKSFFPFLPTK